MNLKKQRLEARERFLAVRRAEGAYRSALLAVGRNVGSIVKGFIRGGIVTDPSGLYSSLEGYSRLLRPWAVSVTAKMQGEVLARDAKAWEDLAKTMGRSIRREIVAAPVGTILRDLLSGQVHLITSLPLRAAERVHQLTIEGLSNSRRAAEVAVEIARSGKVTTNQAILIARTETSRTAADLLEVRAKHLGSEGYIWRTSVDSDVRKLHRKLEGKTFTWDAPPVSGENGERSHPGCIYNCRCWAEPILPDEITMRIAA
jgi:SPP1 gp7 family putative phage head morphogenesis protein